MLPGDSDVVEEDVGTGVAPHSSLLSIQEEPRTSGRPVVDEEKCRSRRQGSDRGGVLLAQPHHRGVN